MNPPPYEIAKEALDYFHAHCRDGTENKRYEAICAGLRRLPCTEQSLLLTLHYHGFDMLKIPERHVQYARDLVDRYLSFLEESGTITVTEWRAPAASQEITEGRCPLCSAKFTVPLYLGDSVRCLQCGILLRIESFNTTSMGTTTATVSVSKEKMPQTLDECFELLGTNSAVCLSEAQSAFRKKIMQCHPDKVQDLTLKAMAEDNAKRLTCAWGMLKTALSTTAA